MTFQPGANLYTQGFGSRPENVEVPHIDLRAPNSTDILYPIGKIWLYVNNSVWYLLGQSTITGVTTSNWSEISNISGPIVSVAGTANQITAITTGGAVVLSLTGPYVASSFPAHTVLLGEGTSSIATTAVGTTGQVLTGVTGSDPIWAAPAGSGTVTSVSGTTNQIAVATGTTTPVISLVGPYTPSTYALHGILYGNATSSILATSAVNNGVLITSASGVPSLLADGTTGMVLTATTGAPPSWASPATSGTVTSVSGTANQVAIATGTTTPVISLIGPYTPSTYTAHGVLIGEGTSSIGVTAVGTTGQVLTGVTGSDPVWASPATAGTVTSTSGTANQIDVATGTTTPALTLSSTLIAPGSIGSTTTITAGTGITSTTGAITATNGNLVLGTAGNKILSTSVGTVAAAGANSFGSVTLVSGTATVATTAVTASSLIFLSRQSLGATGAAPVGMLYVGTIIGGTSFEIHAATTATATTDVATDVSVVSYMIVN